MDKNVGEKGSIGEEIRETVRIPLGGFYIAKKNKTEKMS